MKIWYFCTEEGARFPAFLLDYGDTSVVVKKKKAVSEFDIKAYNYSTCDAGNKIQAGSTSGI